MYVHEMTFCIGRIFILRGIVLFNSRGYVFGILCREVWKMEKDENRAWVHVARREYRGIHLRVPECEL